MLKYSFAFLLLGPLQASSLAFECKASDQQGKEWTIISKYQKKALYRALEACKKQSPMPKTCSISAPSCAYIGGHHHNGSSLWYCTALDRNALPYVGSIYATLQKAALSALHACKNHSPMQETCYMNTATCQNIGD